MSSISLLFAAEGDEATVVFPHAGGSPRFFYPWAPHWRNGPVWGVTYPCRDARMSERMPATVQQLAADVGADIVRQRHEMVATHTPAPSCEVRLLRLLGHSLGALVAYETARWLVRHRAVWDPQSEVVVQLVVSGHDAPHLGAPPDYEVLHTKTDAGLIAALSAEDPHNAEVFAIPELAALLLPAMREDYRLAETYRCSSFAPQIDEIMVVYGEDDPDCCDAGAQAWRQYARRWRGVFRKPGDHFYLGADPSLVPDTVRRLTATP